MTTRFLIVYPYANISTNPSMLALIENFTEQGVNVDILSPADSGDEYPRPNYRFGRVNHIDSPNSLRWLREPSVQKNPSHQSPILALKRWLFRQQLAISPPPVVDTSNYHCVIAVDPEGLAAAYRLGQGNGTPVIYVSFELMFADELQTTQELLLKDLERKALANVDLVIVQDEHRGRTLCSENNFPERKICYLPVAPSDTSPQKTDYLHRKLELSSDLRIVLFQGSIAPWSGRGEWDMLVDSWPTDVVLVVHSRSRLNVRQQKFLRTISNSGRIVFTDEPVSAEELPLLTASADVGLVSYTPSPDSWYDLGNLKAVGLASGKFSYFMMCGVPVISNQKTTLAAIIEENGLGSTYSRPEESARSLKDVLENRDSLSRNSRTFFCQRLDPKVHMQSILSRVLGILHRGTGVIG